LPAFISVLMFCEMTFLLLPFLSGLTAACSLRRH
jgi:hypothetical protein